MKTAIKGASPAIFFYDDRLVEEGYTLIGVDEVGRGPLAGPVVASAVYISPHLRQSREDFLIYVQDSKKFTSPKQKALRSHLADMIKQHCLTATCEVSVQEINTMNILRASLLAMEMAVRNVVKQLDDMTKILVLVDGKYQLNLGYIKQIPVKKGDTFSLSIASASIVAKEYRDQLMKNLAKEFPAYGWEQNSGYPTKNHRNAILQYGKTVHHRNFKVKPVV